MPLKIILSHHFLSILSFAAVKDYYAILNVPVTATLPEIKRAYRKLAMQHHPDKTNDDPYSLASFNEIKEAYETLTSPQKKQLYLNERWLAHAHQLKEKTEAVTPVSILKKSLELNKLTAAMDVHRMNEQLITEKILFLLSNETIHVLQTFNEPDMLEKTALLLLGCCKKLTVQSTEKITEQVCKLSSSTAVQKEAHTLLKNRKRSELYERYQPVLLLLLTAVICMIIYFAAA